MINLTDKGFALLKGFAKRTEFSLSHCVELALIDREREHQPELASSLAKDLAKAVFRFLGMPWIEAKSETTAEPEREAQVRAPEPLE